MSFYCVYSKEYVNSIRDCGTDTVCDCDKRDLDPAHATSDQPWRLASGSPYEVREDLGRVIGTFKSPIVARHIVALHNDSLKGGA